MSDNKNNILVNLRRLGLTGDECRVYVVLLKQSMSHLEIARKTGINRTKVYRIVDDLIKRGLVTENQDDTGRQVAASDPANLEITLKTEEELVEAKKAILDQTLPNLQALFLGGAAPQALDFEVNTYEGVDGFKQMLWNELKTKNEILIFGHGTIQDLIASPRWAEKHRERTLEASYIIREILNPGNKRSDFTKNEAFIEQVYNKRYISPAILPLAHQLCIYNNTVSIYNWRNGQKVGVEIINKDFADMQRAVFERYWQLAE